MPEKLYKMRNGIIVKRLGEALFEVVKSIPTSKKVGDTYYLLYSGISYGEKAIKIDGYYYFGGMYGSNFDIIENYNEYIQEELEI